MTATGSTDHRAALAEFLRARREAVSPAQVGLPAGRARRTPGLRREEVAMLAGVSVTWYTWLEQGRRINASADVLRAIGRALRLDEAGTEHLLALAQPSVGAPADATAAFGPDDVPSALRRLIDAFEPAPAYVLGPRWEFAAWNAAEARLYPPITTLQPPERNLLWVLFADPATRALIVDWDIHAKQSLAEFRASTTAMRDDPALLALVERLRDDQPGVRAMVARARRRPLRDPAAPVRPSGRRAADVRVPVADARRVAVADRGGAPPGARRRLRPAPGRPPPRRLTLAE